MATGIGPAGLPWPEGEPGQLRTAARTLGVLAQEVGSTAGKVRSRARVEGFRGPTALLFRPAVAGVGRQLQSGAGPLAGAGGAVSRLAGTLGDAQDEIRRLAREVETAEREAAEARAAADTAARNASPLAVLTNPASNGNFFALHQAAMSARARAIRLETHAATVRADAERRARQLCDDVDEADLAAAGAVDAAAGAAPAGGATGGVPGAPAGLPGVPPEVARFAPMFFFHPDERYLPADATRDWFDYVRDGRLYPGFFPDEFLRGTGNGAPIYYHYDRENRRIDYWYWRRWNDFRNLGIPVAGVHAGDWEGMSVQLDESGRPSHVGYRQHGPICAMPWDEANKADGRPAGWPAEGSGATYHRPGSYDEPPGPWNDLAGGKPGEEAQQVDAALNLQALDDQPWANDDRRWGPDHGSPQNPADQLPSGQWWDHACPDPDDTVH